MKLALTMYNVTYTIETKNDDNDSEEMLELMKRLLVCAGYPTSILEEKIE